MTNYDLIYLLGRAFADGEADALAPYLAKDCVYKSEYANNRFDSAEEIIKRLKHVFSSLDDTNRYTYSIVQLDEITDLEKVQSKLNGLT